MKRKLIFLLSALMLPMVAVSEASFLHHLDESLRIDYVSARQNYLDSLARNASTAIAPWEAYHQLAWSYSDFNLDSALIYCRRASESATTPTERVASLLQLASLYNSSLMMYKEAGDIFNAINPDSIPATVKRDYYILGVQLYRNLQSLAAEEQLRRDYSQRKRSLRDSVLKIAPGEKFILANELIESGRPDEAIALVSGEIKGQDYEPSNGALYHLLVQAWAAKGDEDKQIEYLAKAASVDMENGVREYLALPQLALMLYERGDLKRAYRYMQRSIEDARACKAKVRIFDMSEAVSVISDAYSAQQRQERRLLMWLLGVMVLLLIATAVLFYYALQRNKLLVRARAELEESNVKLVAAANIKEKYFHRFMRLSREYLKTLDSYRTRLFKIGAQRNFDMLFEAIKAADVVEETSETFFQSFDTAFLELYPNFIEEFNSLLRPEERIIESDRDSLNTDLRIFALMKLGFTESAEISRFLHCSQSTVYNYRARYRSKAKDKERFDAYFA
ncbi:MAG: hypothetical protein K2G64_05470 [Muribaculaceae bacterium]|nr:hypothetical protein [Muribaculaceae bacterium]